MSWLIVGYSAKEQLNTKPTGIITFQWDAVNGGSTKLNGFVVPSIAGTAYNHGQNDDATTGWELTAPKIQVRNTDGSYSLRYYADDMWDETLCTEANDYDPDKDGIAGIAGWGTADGVYDNLPSAQNRRKCGLPLSRSDRVCAVMCSWLPFSYNSIFAFGQRRVFDLVISLLVVWSKL